MSFHERRLEAEFPSLALRVRCRSSNTGLCRSLAAYSGGTVMASHHLPRHHPTSSPSSSILKTIPLWNSEGTWHKSFPLIYDALGSLMRSIPAYQTICGVAPSALCAMFCRSSCRSAARHCRDRSTTAPSHSNATFSTREQVEKNWPTRQGSDDPNRNFARGQKRPRQSIGHREKHAADQK